MVPKRTLPVDGAAFGMSAWAWLITSSRLIPMLIAIFGLMTLLLIHLQTNQRTRNGLYLWK